MGSEKVRRARSCFLHFDLTVFVRFFEYIPDGKSAEGAQTPIHFARLLRDVIPETSNIAGVLKCINQVRATIMSPLLDRGGFILYLVYLFFYHRRYQHLLR